MADQAPTSSAPVRTPTTVCVTAHRLDDNHVLVTAEDHGLHGLEQEMRALEDTALAAELTTQTEATTDV